MQLQLNADSIGAHGPSTVADSDDDLLSDSGDEQLNDDSYSSSDESTHSVEAPPYSPIVMDGTDSEDEDFDVDLCIASDSSKIMSIHYSIYICHTSSVTICSQ